MRIKKLDPSVYRIIAAGEVVERPASVVKELVENSIDARASKIIVEVEKGGIEKIKVIDDGEGIEKDDFPLAFEHHATSKVASKDDLLNIQTMGFRGEALSSISAVSKVTLISKTKTSPTGFFYSVMGGELLDRGVKAFQNGTSIEVGNLFFNVPARQKFLKTPFTEFLHITRVFIELCLANTAVSFKLFHNGREIYNVKPASDFLLRIKALFGEDTCGSLIPIFCEDPHIKISGFIGNPQMAYDSKSKQFVLVNNRPVRDRIIGSAVRRGFGSLIMHNATPVYFIKVSVPYDFVDVNIHPAKEEVKFRNPNLIYSLTESSISKALSQKDLSFRASPRPRPGTSPGSRPESRPDFGSGVFSTPRPQNQPREYSALEFYSKLSIEKDFDVLVFNNLYIVAVTNEAVEIYDQHALHERILYDKFKKAFFGKISSSQSLLVPQTLEVPEDDFQVLMSKLALLKKLGFYIEPFGVRTLKITAVPSFLGDNFSKKINTLMEFAEDLKDKGILKEVGNLEERALSIMACRVAVKAGDSLTNREALELIKEGNKLEGVYTCPHGRPFKIKISDGDLETMFKRII